LAAVIAAPTVPRAVIRFNETANAVVVVLKIPISRMRGFAAEAML
jgi:hypothetical protein